MVALGQHFLLSAQARTLTLGSVFRMGDDQAYDKFRKMRWPETDGKAVCPKCGCAETYDITTRRRFKCMACHTQFSVTSGTIFASRKLSFTTLLAAIVMFVHGAKGKAALHVSRDLDVQYKTAFVLMHKLREAMAAESANQKLSGTVEVDGAYFGGYVKPANEKKDRRDRRLLEHQTGKRQVVIVMRERRGRTLAFVAPSEAAGAPRVLANVDHDTMLIADESAAWERFHARHETMRVNHSQRYMDRGVHTNNAESFFSRLRRSEIGVHHHIAGPYLNAYAVEMTWREDNRRVSNGTQTVMVAEAALALKPSRQWKGYWQRKAA